MTASAPPDRPRPPSAHPARPHSGRRRHRHAAWPLLGFGLALALAACGGHTDPDSVTDSRATAARVIAPLLSDDGSVLPSDARAVPADAGARTAQQRYALPEQARMLTDALGDGVGVITADVGCCGADAADLAVLTALGVQAAHDLPPSTPVLVRGADLRLAAVVADRLADAGLSRVFLVTP